MNPIAKQLRVVAVEFQRRHDVDECASIGRLADALENFFEVRDGWQPSNAERVELILMAQSIGSFFEARVGADFQNMAAAMEEFRLVLRGAPPRTVPSHPISAMTIVEELLPLRLRYHSSASNRGSDHDSRTDQHEVLDDVLPFQRRDEGDLHEHFMREQNDRRQRAEHLHVE